MTISNLSVQGVYSQSGLISGGVLGTLSLGPLNIPNYGANVLIKVKAFQTGVLNNVNNLEVFADGVSLGKILMPPTANIISEFECVVYADETVDVVVKAINGSVATSYHAEISAKVI